MGGGLWQGFFLQTGAKSKVNEASQKRSLEFVFNNQVINQLISVSSELFTPDVSCIIKNHRKD